MRVLFVGDVVGRSGRAAANAHLANLRAQLKLDFVVVNAENAAGGFGLTAAICEELFEAGADVLTTGNHVWDKREIIPYMENDNRVLRPANFPEGTPGNGSGFYQDAEGRQILVVNVMGRLFMDPLDDPFAAVDRQMADTRLAEVADFILVDVHAEATSEKMAMGHYLDGRASLVVGTHTHIPTSDTMILTGGTAYQTDAGMTGDYDSVIGMKKQSPVERFTTKMPTARLEPADGEGTLSGIFVETDAKSGLAIRAEPVRVGGRLSETVPVS